MIANDSRYQATQVWRRVAEIRRARGDLQGAEQADRNADILVSVMAGHVERRGHL